MERYISFKLLTSVQPISIKTSATNMAELTDEIIKNETLSESIQITPTIDGTSKTYVVLVNSVNGEEYSFNNPTEPLPEGNLLFYVIPITSKFGQENKVSLEVNGIKITISIESAKSETEPKFNSSELREIHSKALELYQMINREKNNLIITAQKIQKDLDEI